MVFCVGLTGNIASGKSTVAVLFTQLGIDVFNADHIAKQLTSKGFEAYDEIVAHFGTTVLDDSQQLNRIKLREIIFADPLERQWLEQLLHPKIRQQLAVQVAATSSPYCIAEIPLLTDKTYYSYIDRILLITSSIDLQIERLTARDQCTVEQAKAILTIQPSIEERLALADDVLENTGDLIKLEQRVQALNKQYIQQSKLI